MIKIDKHIPLPEHDYNSIYPLKTMEVGDSFLVEGNYGKRAGIYTTAKRIGIKIRTKKDGNKFRVWRSA